MENVEITIVDQNDSPVTDETEARAAYSEAIGTEYLGPIRGYGDGDWLVTLPEGPAAQLTRNGHWGTSTNSGHAIDTELIYCDDE
jgi:hypothetical protein